MATYLYNCEACGNQEEVTHSMFDTPVIYCDACLATFPMKRMITAEYSGASMKTGENNLSDWEETKFR